MATETPNGFFDKPLGVASLLPFESDKQPEACNGFRSIQLPVKGQGVLVVKNILKAAFEIIFVVDTNKTVSLRVAKDHSTPTQIVYRDRAKKEILGIYDKIFVDLEKDAPYWISLFCPATTLTKDLVNVRIKYGVGEARESLACIQLEHDLAKDFANVCKVTFSEHLEVVRIERDPIVVEPPLAVIPADRFTIEDADRGTYAVPANLTRTGQLLYGNISGANFQINTSDFPDFTAAIEHSIKDPKGWCHKTLKNKEREFGSFEDTYLRITVGRNQGESPGIPYVIEIWPPGHCSPIHNHAASDAIIRVLYGQINVKLYPMLSNDHKTPFREANFEKDDVTWISPTLNQTHKLHNIHKEGPTCITIQCYMYDSENTSHYPYFDYMDKKEAIEQFNPHSDADFLTFKNTIKKEWDMHLKNPPRSCI